MEDLTVLERKLLIGFEHSLTLEKRHSLIFSDIPLNKVFDTLQIEPKFNQVKQCLNWLKDGFGDVIWYKERSFPEFFPIERHLPYMFFYKGQKPNNNQKVTIVGTRYATEEALQRAFCLGLESQINNITVVSGMAHGIDQAAARGALSAVQLNLGCNMIGVLGCGLEVDYPVMSRMLKDKIVSNGGTLISQFAPFEPAFKQNFPNRNLTMAAYSQATIVVQAPEKSGSLITADFALQMGKDVYVTEEGIKNSAKNTGSLKLSEEGASIITSVSNLFETKLKVVRTEKIIKPFARYGEYNYTIVAKT